MPFKEPLISYVSEDEVAEPEGMAEEKLVGAVTPPLLKNEVMSCGEVDELVDGKVEDEYEEGATY